MKRKHSGLILVLVVLALVLQAMPAAADGTQTNASEVALTSLAASAESTPSLPQQRTLSPEETAAVVKRLQASDNGSDGQPVTVVSPETAGPVNGHEPVFKGGSAVHQIKVTVPKKGDVVASDNVGLVCVAYYQADYQSVQMKLNWWVSSTECPADTVILGVIVQWYKANVNTPSSTYPTISQEFHCHWWNNNCRTTSVATSHRVNSTQYVRASFLFCIMGSEAPSCDEGWITDFAYPDSGAKYPTFIDTRGGGIAEFPGAPSNGWNRCADDRTKTPPCARGTNFRQSVVDFHTLMGWRVPTGRYDAHHDIPLCKGGGNSATNGMFVYYLFHQSDLHSWWRGFVTTRSGRPAATEADRITADIASGIQPTACLDADD